MDMLHKGHLNLLRALRAEAGTAGAVLMILHDDKSCYDIKEKFPVQTLKQRMTNVRLTGLVDLALATYSTDPGEDFLNYAAKYGKNLEKGVFMRADDNKNFPGMWAIEKLKFDIKFVPYTNGISSSKIRDSL